MAEPSAQSFLKILERSGIVAEDRLKTALAELSQKSNGKTVKVDALTAHLIGSGLLTRWHCDKLLAGKYKGFFLGKYKLLVANDWEDGWVFLQEKDAVLPTRPAFPPPRRDRPTAGRSDKSHAAAWH